jgi:hypothetical protein
MRNLFTYSLLVSLCFSKVAFSLTVSSEDANAIGEKIWKNECANTLEGLTTWKKGENFFSLGLTNLKFKT